VSNRFQGKVALVTGGASGIGKAVAIRLATEGARVFACDRDAAKLNALVDADLNITPINCDVTDAAQVTHAVRTAHSDAGRINILINNAGIGPPVRCRLHEVALADWDKVMAVNVRGAFLMLREVVPFMLTAGGGAIVNMASVGGFRATALSSAYITSKGAVLMMTRAAAVEYAKDNIRVNAVCPGTTATDILANSSPELVEMLVSRSPQGRLGLPEEVAALTAFLASDEAPHITGGAYIIDGGRCAS